MSTITLWFKDGIAILEENDEPTWSSDDDEDFPTDIGAADQLDIEDATRIMVYLVEQGILTERESQLCSIEEDDDEPDVIDAEFEEVNTQTRPS